MHDSSKTAAQWLQVPVKYLVVWGVAIWADDGATRKLPSLDNKQIPNLCNNTANHLVDGQVGVRADDGAPRKVHTLAAEVASEPTLLALQSLHKTPAPRP
jgi:hypothetical protein